MSFFRNDWTKSLNPTAQYKVLLEGKKKEKKKKFGRHVN